MKVWKTEKIVYFNPKIPKKIDNKSKSNSNKNIKNPEQNLTSKFLLNKKTNLFKVETFEEYFSNESKAPNSGRWTLKEHILFLQALEKFGVNWKRIGKVIQTRTANQIRSHCQKFVIKLKNCKDEELGIDFTLDNIHNMDDIINHIRSVNKNFDVVNILLYMSGKYLSNINSRNLNKIKKIVDVNNIFEQDIKNNINDEINFNEILGLNQGNRLIEEKRYNPQLINYKLDNNNNNINNSFKQNMNFFNNNMYNLNHNYINNPIIMNLVYNINNNINLCGNIQNLNNFNIYNGNQDNSLNNKISEKNCIIKNNNDKYGLNINNINN